MVFENVFWTVNCDTAGFTMLNNDRGVFNSLGLDKECHFKSNNFNVFHYTNDKLFS